MSHQLVANKATFGPRHRSPNLSVLTLPSTPLTSAVTPTSFCDTHPPMALSFPDRLSFAG